jgi:hypothetical protein
MQTSSQIPDHDNFRAAIAAIRRHLELATMAVDALEAGVDRKEGPGPKDKSRKDWRLEVAGWSRRKGLA